MWAVVSFVLVYDPDIRAAISTGLWRLGHTVVGSAVVLGLIYAFGLHRWVMPVSLAIGVLVCGVALRFHPSWKTLLVTIALVAGSALLQPGKGTDVATLRADRGDRGERAGDCVFVGGCASTRSLGGVGHLGAAAVQPDLGGALHAREDVVDGLAALADEVGSDDLRHEVGFDFEDLLRSLALEAFAENGSHRLRQRLYLGSEGDAEVGFQILADLEKDANGVGAFLVLADVFEIEGLRPRGEPDSSRSRRRK